MAHMQGVDRDQMMFTSLGSMVADDSLARVVDAFVDSMDVEGIMREIGEEAKGGESEDVAWPKRSVDGRPSYGPGMLLKLFIWGYRNGIRSSRKLAWACETNVEAMWLANGLTPDFRTIADFRKDNPELMRRAFREFNRRLNGAVEWGFCSVDGSKFRASNSKMNNFTAHKLDDRIQWLNAHIDNYLEIIALADELDEAAEAELEKIEAIRAKLAEAQERLDRYEGLRDELERSGESQISTTDPDSRLMKSKNGYVVGYNPQTAVDSNTHLIRDFEVTNAVTDHGQLEPTLSGVAAETEGILEATADKGYQSKEDMVACLERGILPHVIADNQGDSYVLELAHEEAGEAELDPSSTDPAEISRCLHAGVVPEAYAGAITRAEVRDVRHKVVDEEPSPQEPYGSTEEMTKRAKEGYFVRDPGRNLVHCPAGETLRQKSVKRSGATRYANKTACRRCKHRNECFSGKQDFKEGDFTKDQLEKPCAPWHECRGTEPDKRGVSRGKYHYERGKVVFLTLVPDVRRTNERMQLSEHPFGTMKRSMGYDHFLLRGLRKVTGEFSLMCLGYNLIRARTLLGFDGLLGLMRVPMAPAPVP